MLTATGIVLGVALLFGVLVSSAGVNRALDRLSASNGGRADVRVLGVGAYEAGLPESAIARVERLPGVTRATPDLYFGSRLLNTTARRGTDAIVDGARLSHREAIATTYLLAGRYFTPGAPEVVLNEHLALFLRVHPGDRVRVGAASGPSVTVVGVMRDFGAGIASGVGNVAFTSLESAQALSNRRGNVSFVILQLVHGTDVDRWVERHRRDLGPGLDMVNLATENAGFRDFLHQIQASFTASAAIALFVGAFLIYLSLSISVLERTRLYGTLRALGGHPRQVVRVVVSEAAALGAVSSVVGLFVGYGLARAISGYTARGVGIRPQPPLVYPLAVIVSLAVGLAVTLTAALVPARRAAAMAPVEAMKGTSDPDAGSGRGWVVGLLAIAVGPLLYRVATGIVVLSLSVILVLLGAVLLVPVVLRPLARVVGGFTRRLSSGVGNISVMHLVKERSRSASTLALVMVVLALIFSVAASYVSNRRVSERVLDKQYGADLQLTAHAGTFDASFGDALRAVPGAGRVTSFAFGQTWGRAPGGSNVQIRLVFVDPTTYFGLESYPWIHGSDASARSALTRGGVVVLPAPTARRLHAHIGDLVAIETRVGVRRFRVAGVYQSIFEGQRQGVTLSARDGARFFRTAGTRAFDVDVTPGTSVSAFQVRVVRSLAGRAPFLTHTGAEIKARSRRDLDQTFGIFFVMVLLGVVIGLLGLANTLAASVVQRYREIGLLRAVGTLRRQVRGVVLVESATLVAVALALAVPLGWALSAMVVHDTSAALGYAVPYVYPWASIPLVVALAVVVALAAAVAPARRAARLDVVEVLRFD